MSDLRLPEHLTLLDPAARVPRIDGVRVRAAPSAKEAMPMDMCSFLRVFLEILDALAALATIAGFARELIKDDKHQRMTKGERKK